MRIIKKPGNFKSILTRSLERCANCQILTSVRSGLIYMIPLIMTGALINTILNLPINRFQSLLQNSMGGAFERFLLMILNGTFNIISIGIVLSVGYAYAQNVREVITGKIKIYSLMLAAMCSFFVYNAEYGSLIAPTSADSKGILAALIIAIASINIYLKIYRIYPEKSAVYTFDSDSILTYSMGHIAPLIITLIITCAFRLTAGRLIDFLFDSFTHWLANAVTYSSGSILTVVLYVVLVQLLWFMGMHGTNLLDSISKFMLSDGSQLNLDTLASGEIPTQIITTEFFDIFVFLGGAGCTLGLLILLSAFGKARNINRVGRMSIFPGIFNVNETIVYGLPIIFNPYFLLPFILAPVLTCLISYAAFYTGLVPLITQKISWTIPVFFSGYMSTGSVSGIALQLLNLTVSLLVYLPFFLMYEEHIIKSNKQSFETLCRMIMEKEKSGEPMTFLNSAGDEIRSSFYHEHDEISLLIRCLITELSEAFKGEAVHGLHLRFQPKSFEDGRVYGAEALIRWNHPRLGFVPPPVILAISSHAGLGNELGSWVMRTAFTERSKLDSLGYENLTLSVNLSPEQLRTDSKLFENIKNGLKDTQISPDRIELELTEDMAVDQSVSTNQKLDEITKLGIRLSIDDFGMGSSTLNYIKKFSVSVIKLDMSLVRDITDNLYSQEIVRSIINLCNQLDIDVVAEGVETKQQLEKLKSMGCSRFQGYYFSPALTADDFAVYVQSHGIGDTPPR